MSVRKLLGAGAAIGLTMLISGCPGRVDAQGCPKVSATLKAKDANSDKGTTFVRINPDTVKVRQGCPFTINNPGNHTITTTSTTSWLQGGPINGDLQLGPATGLGGPFKYTIEVQGIGVLDPRAFVIK